MPTSELAGGDPVTADKINEITVGTIAPTSPVEGDVWIDTSTSGSPALKAYTGTAWQQQGGGGMDWAVRLTGDPIFPHNSGTSDDVTISTPTTWTEVDYPGRVVQLNRLDIDDILTLQGGPWFIFADVVDWGASGEVRGNGPDAQASPNADYARGADHAVAARGGSGGVMAFIICRESIGTASRPFSCNGGNGSTTSTNGSNNGKGGQGCFSSSFGFAIAVSQNWAGDATAAADVTNSAPHPMSMFVGPGGGGGKGGGSGTASNVGANGGGGSGIGGGGTGGSSSNPGELALIDEPNLMNMVDVALHGCLGGGGGGASTNTTGANNSGGGGGGGCAALICRTITVAPTITANGGLGHKGGSLDSGHDGAAGVVLLVDIP